VNEIQQMLKEGQMGEWLELFKKLKVVMEQDNSVPTQDDIERLRPFADIKVSRESPTDWYCLVRDCQGSFNRILQSGYLLCHLTESETKTGSSDTYVLDFDHNTLIFSDNSGDDNSFH